MCYEPPGYTVCRLLLPWLRNQCIHGNGSVPRSDQLCPAHQITNLPLSGVISAGALSNVAKLHMWPDTEQLPPYADIMAAM